MGFQAHFILSFVLIDVNRSLLLLAPPTETHTQTRRKRETYLKLFEICHRLCHLENRGVCRSINYYTDRRFREAPFSRRKRYRELPRKVFLSITEDSLVCHFVSIVALGLTFTLY